MYYYPSNHPFIQDNPQYLGKLSRELVCYHTAHVYVLDQLLYTIESKQRYNTLCKAECPDTKHIFGDISIIIDSFLKPDRKAFYLKRQLHYDLHILFNDNYQDDLIVLRKAIVGRIYIPSYIGFTHIIDYIECILQQYIDFKPLYWKTKSWETMDGDFQLPRAFRYLLA